MHTAGSGDCVRVFDTEFGALSGLMCGENSNPLLTYSMSALGAKVHVASWPSFFNRAVDMQTIADIACRAIAYQNSTYVISAIGAVDDAMRERLPADRRGPAASRRHGQQGRDGDLRARRRVLAGPVPGGEAIIYADADLSRIVPRKIVHDYAGDYNRFDIFQLVVNVSPGGPPIRLGSVGLNAGDALPAARARYPQLGAAGRDHPRRPCRGTRPRARRAGRRARR